MSEPDALSKLQAWYANECDGDWEHQYGVRVETLDNPGWMVEIDVRYTALDGVPFPELKDNYEDETDWLRCWVEDATFKGACGPLRLGDVIAEFLRWAAASGSSSWVDDLPDWM